MEVRYNKTAQIWLVIVATIICLLYGRSVLADWQDNNKSNLPNDEIINSKPTNWRLLNSSGKSQKYTKLVSVGRDARAIELLNNYGHSGEQVWSSFIHVARTYEVYPEVLLCITYADTSIGKHLRTPYNWGNVGNNDRGDKVSFKNIEQGLNAIGKVLNNQYLGNKNTIGELSPYSGGVAPFYATSTENWEINVLNCMGLIHNKPIKGDFQIRW